MAIYKLGDIGFFKGGISSLKKENYDSGINFVNYMDIFKNSIINDDVKLRKYNANKNDIKKYEVIYGDALFTASSETPNEIAFSSIYLSNKKAIFNGFSKRYRFDSNVLLTKFASFLFRSNDFRKEAKKYATGYTRFNISQINLEKIKINIPSLKIQKQIIDIIEPNEKLFLNYSNCVRIDKVENTKNDMKKLIDIIEPIDKLLLIIQKIINNLIKTTTYSKNKSIKDYVIEKNNGFPYKKNHKNGKIYKIFTIKNIQDKKKYDTTDYSKNNKLKKGNVITGLSGTIGSAKVIIKNNEWVSNQRTLSLKSLFPLHLKIAIEKNKNKLMMKATGAVQKNITSNDILNIPFSIINEKEAIFKSEIFINFKLISNILEIIKNNLIDLLIK